MKKMKRSDVIKKYLHAVLYPYSHSIRSGWSYSTKVEMANPNFAEVSAVGASSGSLACYSERTSYYTDGDIIKNSNCETTWEAGLASACQGEKQTTIKNATVTLSHYSYSSTTGEYISDAYVLYVENEKTYNYIKNLVKSEIKKIKEKEKKEKREFFRKAKYDALKKYDKKIVDAVLNSLLPSKVSYLSEYCKFISEYKFTIPLNQMRFNSWDLAPKVCASGYKPVMTGQEMNYRDENHAEKVKDTLFLKYIKDWEQLLNIAWDLLSLRQKLIIKGFKINTKLKTNKKAYKSQKRTA